MPLPELRARLADLEARIAEGEGRQPAADPAAEHFHLGLVGTGRNTPKLSARKAEAVDKLVQTATELVPLYREREALTRKIADLEAGGPELRARLRSEREARVRAAKVGDTVMDSAYGVVTVARVNRKTLTIETSSGYREARPYSLIDDVVAAS